MRSSPLLGSSTKRICGSKTKARARPGSLLHAAGKLLGHFFPITTEADLVKYSVNDLLDLLL